MVVAFQLALSEKEMMERQTWSYKSKEDRQHNNHWNNKKNKQQQQRSNNDQ